MHLCLEAKPTFPLLSNFLPEGPVKKPGASVSQWILLCSVPLFQLDLPEAQVFLFSCQIPQTPVCYLQVALVRTESWDAQSFLVSSRRLLAGRGSPGHRGKRHVSFLQAERDNGKGWLPRAKEEPRSRQREAWPHRAQAFLFA